MMTSTEKTATISRLLALGLLLATLLAALLSAIPAGAAVASGKAFSWGSNQYGQLGINTDGQLGIGTSGSDTGSDVPVAVQNLTNVRNLDGGYLFTLAATQ